MAYDIWLSLNVRDRLERLKTEDPETYDQIREFLQALSIQRENFQTGIPERIEASVINQRRIY
jgi:hypothetical protein